MIAYPPLESSGYLLLLLSVAMGWGLALCPLSRSMGPGDSSKLPTSLRSRGFPNAQAQNIRRRCRDAHYPCSRVSTGHSNAYLHTAPHLSGPDQHAGPNRDSLPHAGTSADLLAFSHLDPGSDSHLHAGSNGCSHTYTGPNGYASADANGCPHAGSDADANACSHTYTGPNRYADANGCPHAGSDADANACSHTYTGPNGYANACSYADTGARRLVRKHPSPGAPILCVVALAP